MNRLINTLLRRIRVDAYNSEENEEYTFLGDICMTLSWKYPGYTFLHFMALNYMLWMIAFSGPFFCICTPTILVLKFLSQKKNTQEYHPYCEILFNNAKAIFNYFATYRSENPSEFCLGMSLFFLTLSYIGSHFSGFFLLFTSLCVLFFIPFVYVHVLPPHLQEMVKVFADSFGSCQVAIAEEDLFPLPVENREEDLDSLDTDRTADSVTNSLISGISSMPSFLDAEDNNEIMEEDLIPISASQNSGLTRNFEELSSSDSESELKDIHFKESALGRDSSSEEEGAFEEGLHFEESHNQTQENRSLKPKSQEDKSMVHNIVGYVQSASGFQLPNFLNFAMSSVQSIETKDTSRNGSTSDEDFEIIDADELK